MDAFTGSHHSEWVAYECVFCAQVYCLSVSRLFWCSAADGMAGTETSSQANRAETHPEVRTAALKKPELAMSDQRV